MIFFLLGQSAVSAKTLTAGSLNKTIPVFETGMLSETFVVVGKVTVQAGTAQDLLKFMQKKARQYGGEAVLAYRVLEAGAYPQEKQDDTDGGVAVNLRMPAAEGVIVKYGKKGIKNLSDAKEILVLE